MRNVQCLLGPEKKQIKWIQNKITLVNTALISFVLVLQINHILDYHGDEERNIFKIGARHEKKIASECQDQLDGEAKPWMLS